MTGLVRDEKGETFYRCLLESPVLRDIIEDTPVQVGFVIGDIGSGVVNWHLFGILLALGHMRTLDGYAIEMVAVVSVFVIMLMKVLHILCFYIMISRIRGV